MRCINLREWFGDRYKIKFEESYYAERPEFRAAEAAWLMVVPCQHGHTCPWGGDKLAACTNRAGSVAKRLKALPYCRVVQDGDDGANVVFPVDRFDEVAAIMRPRRRRRLPERQRVAVAERLRKYQPTKGQSVKDLARQRSETARISTIEAPGE